MIGGFVDKITETRVLNKWTIFPLRGIMFLSYEKEQYLWERKQHYYT